MTSCSTPQCGVLPRRDPEAVDLRPVFAPSDAASADCLGEHGHGDPGRDGRGRGGRGRHRRHRPRLPRPATSGPRSARWPPSSAREHGVIRDPVHHRARPPDSRRDPHYGRHARGHAHRRRRGAAAGRRPDSSATSGSWTAPTRGGRPHDAARPAGGTRRGPIALEDAERLMVARQGQEAAARGRRRACYSAWLRRRTCQAAADAVRDARRAGPAAGGRRPSARRGDYLERAAELRAAGVDVLVIDIAHGHSLIMERAIAELRERFGDVELVAGNVATADGAASWSSAAPTP